ncbi:hypoxanthine phosphoribosyltransferase [Anaerosphaera aminiphila DSM 21120]|uniref:Hypoxanthine phosphoribosyltransferase n=1 Tax=Anaerosphaera aminiphila DSM 21120 TaxID=1120995 RepID=A0A1M5R178_9FIRM|nr:hypoxanthine phosphoribosyltransferase [Anaerosphaera aminiphila]SHH19901.1 hypoxanthine phosphoribosyltransferase [Anaerosphaera aminiphila DSM 21120]
MKEIEEILYSEEVVMQKCRELGERITADYEGELLVVGILKGAVPFMAELIKRIDLPIIIDFMDVSSYEGTTTSGEVRILKDLEFRVEGRDVLIVEDIIDTGLTLSYLTEVLKKRGAKSIEICSLLTKPKRRKVFVDTKYVGFEVDDKFVVGYGMDYNEKYRNLPFVGILSEEVYK